MIDGSQYNRGNMIPLTIAVDVDGVTADLYPEMFRLYNEEYNDNVTVESAMLEYGHNTWKIKLECGAKILKYFDLPNLYDNIKPIDGALEGVQYLRDLGHRIIFNSSCVIDRSDDKLKWLIKHGFLKQGKTFNFDWMVVSDKSLINADIMIDDRPENIHDFKGVGIIFDQPYNKLTLADARMKGWSEISKVHAELYSMFNEAIYAE